MTRERIPSRNPDVQPKEKYRDYKDELRKDFFQHCGYCGGWDRYSGGTTGFHIDHFAPKKRFPQLIAAYANLIYSCPYCNRSKSDKWIGDDPFISHDNTNGFIDPCDRAFDKHLSRDDQGYFRPSTPVGKYMIKHLRLFLERHRYIWMMQKMEALKMRAQRLRQLIPKNDAQHHEILNMIAELQEKIDEYNDHVYGPRV